MYMHVHVVHAHVGVGRAVLKLPMHQVSGARRQRATAPRLCEHLYFMLVSTCDLPKLAAAGRLHLSTIFDERQTVLGQHWLDHYVRVVGVPLERMTIHFISRDAASVASFTAQLRASGVHDVRWVNKSWSSVDMPRMVDAALRALPPDHYLISPDLDEFYTYPCDLGLDRNDAWCAFMRDPIAPDGMLATIQPDVPITRQFPSFCYSRQHLRDGPTTVQKPTLIRATSLATGRVRSMDGPHLLAHGERCSLTGWYSHYTMTREQLSLSSVKQRDKLAVGQRGGATYYQKVHQLLLLANHTDVRSHPLCAPHGFRHRGQYWPPCKSREVSACRAPSTSRPELSE